MRFASHTEKNITHYKKAPFLGVWDFVLLLALIFAATVALKYYIEPETGSVCTVYVNGEKVIETDLLTDSVTAIPGTHAVLTIKDGATAITENDCPNKICMKTGFVGRAGGTIVCAPNKIVVKISGGGYFVTGVHK